MNDHSRDPKRYELRCLGCGEITTSAQFNNMSRSDYFWLIDDSKCMGCTSCGEGLLQLVQIERLFEIVEPPSGPDITKWRETKTYTQLAYPATFADVLPLMKS